ncbi:MAG: hypothetical protein KAZ26_23540 [Caldilineaceae bacterium]|nr:hypothetical protein [Caldilineaceae bacterium]
MNQIDFERAQNIFLALVVAVALIVLLALPADAAPATYTCTWTTQMWRNPPTAQMRCTNGYSQAYVWSARLGQWVRQP